MGGGTAEELERVMAENRRFIVYDTSKNNEEDLDAAFQGEAAAAAAAARAKVRARRRRKRLNRMAREWERVTVAGQRHFKQLLVKGDSVVVVMRHKG